MKKLVFYAIVTIFTLSATFVFAGNPDRNSETEKSAIPAKKENKLSDEEIDRITKRVEEIRKMDKSDLTSEEKSELKSELKDMKESVKKAGGGIYIGGAALILIIILIILLV
jgi:molecular chaperone DnaK (HSP70)